VFIPDTPAMTFCISTQVGCAMACAFCLTGKMGLVRNLTAGEIVGQVRVLAGALGMRDTAFNIVLMGMGEPLHNYDETMKALRILADEPGFNLPPRRVTLSTVGLLPALERLAAEPVMPNLAISLHAPTDAQRGALVPINKKYNVAEIIAACKRFPLKKRRRITFEYVLLAGVNDSDEDARRLAKLLGGMKAKVNLIPLNAAAGIPFERPSDAAIDRFAKIVADHGVLVSVRKSRGRDIRARMPHASIGSDVIVGFPGETDEDFEALAAHLERSPLTHLHVFPYSDRPGTAASTLGGRAPGTVVRERARRIRDIGRRLTNRFHAYEVGVTHDALTLEDGSLAVTGNYLKLRIPPGRARNEWVRVRVAPGDPLAGVVVENH